MSKIISVRGVEAALATSVGAASTFNNARRVRLVNTAGASHLVTVADENDVTIGTFTLGNHESVIVHKAPTDVVFAANAAVLGVAVEIRD